MTIHIKTLISLNRLIFFTAILCISSFSYSQLDSVEVVLSFTPETDQYGNSYDKLVIQAVVDDSTDVGEIKAYVYEGVDEVLVGRIEKTISELNSGNLISGTTITLEVPYLNDASPYFVNIQMITSSGAYIPLITTDYNP